MTAKRPFIIIGIVIVAASAALAAGLMFTKPNRGIVGFSCYDMKFDYFREMEKGMRNRLFDLGYHLMVHDQQGRTDYQIQGCLALMEQDIKALVISPIDPKVLPKIVEQAHIKGIPVIIDDIGGGGSDYDAFVCPDDIECGRMAAEYLQEYLLMSPKQESPTVLIIRNSPTIAGAFSRGKGFREIATAQKWIIYDIVADGEEDNAYREMKRMLMEAPGIEAVFCTNDPMAIGVVRAIEELGRNDIKVIGVNGDLQALKLIKAGRMLASVQLYPYAMGEIAADVADMLINGQSVDFDSQEERMILMPVRLIDQTNVEEAFEALH